MTRASLFSAVLFTAAVFRAGSEGRAATSYPMLMGVNPVALQAGTSAELNVQSRYSMDGSYRVMISGRGVRGEIGDPHSKPQAAPLNRRGKAPRRTSDLATLKVQFHADKDAPLGIRDIRLAGPYGASTVGQIVIVRDPVVSESKENDTPEKAQAITVPAAVCGSIEKIEDRDYFKFRAEAGRAMVFHVYGMKLENRIHDLQMHLDPILTLRSAAGATVAVGDNDISGDPLLFHRFAQAGEYTLEIRDVRYKGNSDWVYCIEINDRPFVRTAFPLGVAAGHRTPVEPIGYGVERGTKVELLVPERQPAGVNQFALPLSGGPSNPVAMVVSSLPLFSESPGDNDSVKTPTPVSIPAGVNGRIDSESDADVFSFRAKKGEALTFEVVSRRGGSPLDSVLRILDDKGRPLFEGDDLSEFGRSDADAVIESWTPPADGTYAVEVRDLLQRGGPAYVYFLQITRAEPQFEIYLDTDKTELAPGASGALFVNAVRKKGFQGEIELSVEGLPPGVSARCAPIPRNHRDGCIVFKADAQAKSAAGEITVKGKAIDRRDGKPYLLTAVGRPLQETYLPGGGRGHWPVETHVVAVGAPSDLRRVALSTHELALQRGQSARVDVTIERAAGFTDNVTLSPQFEHLGRIYGDTLPQGVTVDPKKSKTLLTGKETQGFITFVASSTAEIQERRPVAIMANVSINFVMKATYSSEPLLVTTRKQD